ncbi:hypothetical protein ACG98H_09025 [Corynebacterium sp. L4756]|uniref:hypothetical protein n=1 Tax=unclassified Corynebacterium TaxID=2624378 RepID=UPI00374CCD78
MSGLSPGYVIQLLNQGKSQTEIANAHGVSRQYVHKLAKQGGLESISTQVTENLPWEIGPDYYPNTIYQALRLYRSWRIDPAGLSKSSMTKMRAFLRKIVAFNQVVDFDPNYPAVPGFTNTPGFAYLPRTEEDKDLIIKWKPGVKLTSQGRTLWTRPSEIP